MARRESTGTMFASFAMLISLILFAMVAVGGFLVWNNDRDGPLRTAQLDLPLLDLPAPPGIIPEAGAAPLAR